MTDRATNWTGVAFGLLLSCFAAYQMFKLPPALPLLLERYGYDRALAGGFMSIYALVGLLLSLPIGRWISLRGAATPMFCSLGLMIAANLLGLVAPAQGLVVLTARGLEGVAFAVLAIIGPVLATTFASPRHLPLVIGMIAAWIPVGQITATLLALAVFQLLGWQSLWLLAIAGSGALWLWGRSIQRQGLLEATPVGGAREKRPSSDGASGEARFNRRERAGLLLTATIFMLWSGQYFAYMTWLPQYLVEIHGATVALAQLGYSLPVATLIVFCLLTGFMLRLGVPLNLLLPVALASQTAIWWLIPVTGGGWPGLASLIAYGIGAGITPTCLFALPSAILGQARSAAPAFALVMTGRNIGVFVGPILLAQAFKMTGGWDVGVPIFGTATCGALLLSLVLGAIIVARR